MTATKTKRVEDINKILDFIEKTLEDNAGIELDEAFYKEMWEDQFIRLLTAGFLSYLIEEHDDHPRECLNRIQNTELRVTYYNLVQYLLAVEESLELYTYDLGDQFGALIFISLFSVVYQGQNIGELFDEKKLTTWLELSGKNLKKRRTRKKPTEKITPTKTNATKRSNEDRTVTDK
jgi:hypothetical protein